MSNTTPSPLLIRLLQTFTLTTSSFATGAMVSLSTHLIPRLLESPAPLLLRQWARIYNDGKKTFPPLSVLTSLSFFYLASKLPSASGTVIGTAQWRYWGYVTAGGLNLAIIPYTILFMRETNGTLLRKEEETRTMGKEDVVVEVGVGNQSVHQLVDWWGVLNLGRGGLMAVASVLGIWSAISE